MHHQVSLILMMTGILFWLLYWSIW